MKRIVLFFSLALCLGLSIRAQSGTTPFTVSLRLKLVADEKLRRNDSLVQTFYIYRPKSADAPMLAYWPEARYLLRMENYDETDPGWDAIAQITKYIDLERDVVANRDAIGSSTYLETVSGVLDDIKKCLDGRRVVFETPTLPDFGPINVIVVRVIPHALKYDNGQLACDYDIVELRVVSPGQLADQIIPMAIPRRGSALYQNIVQSGSMRLRVERWETLATPGRHLKVTTDMKGYRRARNENAPIAVLYAALSDVEETPIGLK